MFWTSAQRVAFGISLIGHQDCNFFSSKLTEKLWVMSIVNIELMEDQSNMADRVSVALHVCFINKLQHLSNK